ncbi:MAG: hypothetical protein ACJ74Y_14415 [Bryobacteraceae bacterium]|jgi:hypothetical protein
MAGESILDSTKKALGIAPDYDVFDVDILMHINTVFTVLSQLGIGPEDGFLVEDAEAVWEDFLGIDKQLNSVRTYVFLRVKILFDPPGNSFVMNALNEQIRELEWRLSVQREGSAWQSPLTLPS